MLRKTKLKIAYYLNASLIAVLVGYQLYINLEDTEYASLHLTQINEIQQRLEDKGDFEFAVVGNINNSSSIFQKQLIPELGHSDAAFLISAGNAVSSGAEENYRSLIGMLGKLAMPWLMTYGQNEDSDFGNFRYFQYFGPPFFSFSAGNNHFIFLDNTDNTPYRWQLDWLEQELSRSAGKNQFVFMGRPIHPPVGETSVFTADNYFDNRKIADQLHQIFKQHQVEAVFSANLPVFADPVIDGVQYVTTGGAGGLIVEHDNSYHHYSRVRVEGDKVSIEPQRFVISSSPLQSTLSSLWSAIYTFFYVSFARFLVVLSLLVIVGLKLREFIYAERDYYTDFNIDDSAYRDRRKRIAFFSNNYFPFISGVTISIERLAAGLRERGHRLQLFVPGYPGEHADTQDCTRVKTLMAFGSHGEFRLTNLFQPQIGKTLRRFKPDLIHVHHPFWLGSVGLWLGKRLKRPVVYTYHTRLEMYAHYVPLPGALFRNVISHAIVRRFCNRCDGVIVPTYAIEEYLRLIGVKTRICVQPSGVDFDRFHKPHQLTATILSARHQLDPERLTLITVSRLGKEKNIKFLIDAIASLDKDTRRQVQLLIAGEGDDRAFLENRITELSLEDTIHLIGAVSPEEMPAYYQMSDLFVFASKSETQGMVILEAMSAGLPAVAIRSSGIEDVIINGETGFKTLDDIEKWNARLKQLIHNPQLRAQFSANATAFARQHDTARFAEQVDGFYSEVMAAYYQQNH